MSLVVERGSEVLRELLASRLRDVRTLAVGEFAGWLERHLAHWRRDPAFAQRARIRDLRRANPALGALEEEHRLARAADEASPLYEELEAVLRELTGADKAVAGLSYALRDAEAAERERLQRKRERFEARAAELRARSRELSEASPTRLAVLRLAERIERMREELGLAGEEERLRKLQRSKGRSRGRSGAAFEDVALQAVRRVVLPELDDGGAPLELLRGVTLGAARTEIDQLLVRAAPEPGGAVEVLALVEAKRNINDLARGLHRRLENMSWLAGRADGHDPELYRTAAFPRGIFEGVAMHERGGRRHRFTEESFRHLHAGADPLAARLYLVTRPGPLWGIGSAGLARIAHRVSSDVGWDPADPEYMAGLLRWCQALAEPVEAPDVLRRYADDPAAGRRVLLVRGSS